MPTTPWEMEINYLHTCNGPIAGRYLTLSREAGTTEIINLAEVAVLNEPQPEDFSDYHGINNVGCRKN